jgi:hypothetical protein
LEDGGLIYIATDKRDKSFFGTFFSTLSGYADCMHGYYIVKHKLEGYQDGTMESFHFILVSEFVSFSLIDTTPTYFCLIKLGFFMSILISGFVCVCRMAR